MLDGEDPGTGSAQLDAHLAECVACRQWRDAAHEVTRRARVQLPEPVSSRAADVLAAVRAQTRVPRRRGPVPLARAALVGVAAAQLALTVPYLVFGHDHSAPEHIAHEMGSFGAALAVGFLITAWRPARALGMRAVLGVAAVLLMVTAVIDLVAGRTSLGDEAPHLLAVAGWLLVRYLAAATPPMAEDPGSVLVGVLRSRRHVPLRQALRSPAARRGPATRWAAPGLVLNVPDRQDRPRRLRGVGAGRVVAG
jgi:predicted anti-sigma-YlaC factor YlaD